MVTRLPASLTFRLPLPHARNTLARNDSHCPTAALHVSNPLCPAAHKHKGAGTSGREAAVIWWLLVVLGTTQLGSVWCAHAGGAQCVKDEGSHCAFLLQGNSGVHLCKIATPSALAVRKHRGAGAGVHTARSIWCLLATGFCVGRAYAGGAPCVPGGRPTLCSRVLRRLKAPCVPGGRPTLCSLASRDLRSATVKVLRCKTATPSALQRNDARGQSQVGRVYTAEWQQRPLLSTLLLLLYGPFSAATLRHGILSKWSLTSLPESIQGCSARLSQHFFQDHNK